MVTLSWHPSGSHLAVLPRGHPFAMVWSAASKDVARVDGGIKVRLRAHCGGEREPRPEFTPLCGCATSSSTVNHHLRQPTLPTILTTFNLPKRGTACNISQTAGPLLHRSRPR